MNHLVMPDTTKLSRKGLALFAGVEQTNHGLKIKMHDQLKALEMVGKYLGVFEAHNRQKELITADALLLAMLDRIKTKGSKLQLNRAATMLDHRAGSP